MNGQSILSFLTDLIPNNNREWFAENKDRYDACRKDFELIGKRLIESIALFDESIKMVEAKDCIFRIYRDARFSKDKSPYKNHFGLFIAAKGGRKSIRGGYYFHLEPGNSFIATGVWCPQSDLLKMLRQAVFDNFDEFTEIMDEAEFKKMDPVFFNDDQLKTAPKGFPKDFEGIDFLRLKHYMLEKKLGDIPSMDDMEEKVADLFRITYPMNRFLNYTVDEYEHYQK